MRLSKKLVSGAAVSAAVLATMVSLSTPASAATTPAFEPDANSQGSVTFYDSAGQVVTSGNNLSHLFDYAEASTGASRATTKAFVTFGFPNHAKPDSSTWFQAQGSTATPYPNTAAPAPLNTSTKPVATVVSTEANLAAQLGVVDLDSTDGYANIVQIRLKDTGPGIPVLNKPFWETDIMFDQAAGTWQQIYPAPPSTATQTTTTLAVTPPSPQPQGTSVTLTATVTPTAAGSVQFQDGSTAIGTPVAVTGGTASISTSTLAAGPHSLAAVFTPTDPAAFTTSTSAAQNYTITSTSTSTSGTYVAVAPTRLLDTRSGSGGTTPGPNGTVALQVSGRGGVPAGVSAVVLNVTVDAPTAFGFITAWADGTPRPGASNLNFAKGETVPNLVVAPVAANGKVDLYNGSTGKTQLIADVAGYFLGGTPTVPGAYVAVAPTRLLDTRSGSGGTTPGPNGTVALQVSGRGGVPAGVSAVVLNVTVDAPTAFGFITAWADGTPRPGASNLNFAKGETVPNLVVAPVAANGKVDLYNGSTGKTQLIADVAGYFLGGTPTVPGAYVAVAPTRLLDTRSGSGGTTPGPNGTVALQVSGRGGVPAGVSAVVLNVTVDAPTAFGFITAWADGTPRPGASNLNFAKGETVPNLVVAPVAANGKVDLYNGSTGKTQLIGDVAGYFIGPTG